MTNPADLKVDVPPGVCGEHRVEQMVVTHAASDFTRMRAAMHGGRGYVPAGTYTALYRGRRLVMSDTPDEVRDHLPFIDKACGRVLIAGLGIGMVANAVLHKPEVEHVDIVEISDEVITLVGPSLDRHAGRYTIHHGDIFDWPGLYDDATWTYAWFDIWDTICEDNFPSMTKLHVMYARKTAWRGSWSRDALLRIARR